MGRGKNKTKTQWDYTDHEIIPQSIYLYKDRYMLSTSNPFPINKSKGRT